MDFGSVVKKYTLGLSKTRESLFGSVRRFINAKRAIDDDLLEHVEEALLAGDVGVETTAVLIENLRQRVKKEAYHSSEELDELLKDEVVRVLHVNGSGMENGIVIPPDTKPYVVMVVGVNGVGKTTTIGKLAYLLRNRGLNVTIGAADTFRAAANEQLEVWAQRAGVDLVRQAQGSDPASVAFDTLSSAIARKSDVVIIDTAGRLHTKTNLMEELKKIRRVLEKRLVGAPHEVLLVIDAGTGQNGLLQAKEFAQAAGVTGIVLTKLDGTAKGGIVLAICAEMSVPVKYIGVGEQLDDLQPFDRRAFVEALFGDHNIS